MIDLFLSMLISFNEYGDSIGFSKSDIDKLIKKYNVIEELDISDCNERGWIVLWKNEYISTEKFSKHLDIEYEDEHFWLIINNFDDILPNGYETEIEILDGIIEYEPSDYQNHDIGRYYWSDYTEETLKVILNYCINNGIEIQGELMTSENTRLRDGDIYFTFEESSEDTKLSDMIDDEDGLDEVRELLSNAVSSANDVAERDAAYAEVKKRFINAIGPFKYKQYNGKEKLFVRMDIEWYKIEEFLVDKYGELEFVEESYGGLREILDDMEVFKFKQPDYNYIGSTYDKDMLNELTRDELNSH